MSKTADVLIEAAERLELLGFDGEDDVVQGALAGEEPLCSDNTISFAIAVDASGPKFVLNTSRRLTVDEKDRVDAFRKKFHYPVYHVIRSDFGEIGILEAYLYIAVPLDDDDCKAERKDIKNGYPTAYVYNITNPELSEFGSIGVEFWGNAILWTA